MIILIVVGAILAVAFVGGWIRSDATMNPDRAVASTVAALSLGGLVLVCMLAFASVLTSY